jgi:hypothetical protein
MSPAALSLAAAVPGLTRSDPSSPGITRERSGEGFRYRDPSGAEVTQGETVRRIGALAIPPAWTDVWISPDPMGHIQATGVDSRGRTQYRYHQAWREQRDAHQGGSPMSSGIARMVVAHFNPESRKAPSEPPAPSVHLSPREEEILRYIGQVLPSLGETSVVLSTVGQLFPGLDARRTEAPP